MASVIECNTIELQGWVNAKFQPSTGLLRVRQPIEKKEPEKTDQPPDQTPDQPR